jgi:uncharacterized membrane protein YiaA
MSSNLPGGTPAGLGRTGPTPAFVGVSWIALLLGTIAYLIGLWNAQLGLNEKGYYLTLLMYGLFGAVSLQKSVRDRAEGIPVTGIYFGLCWIAVLSSLVLLSVGLWNAALAPSEKGFYAMSFALCLFAAVAVQKNVRDLAQASPAEVVEPSPSGQPPTWP